ncbi:BapA prefix-like domain-containing protein [Acinetobacter baumannii]|nr:BapA prefix-like domain-containing protein [Acinetobacter baumannii]NMR36867.1 BapA prefix-like domain-containing protein [Acinetobacter baumannii]
MPEIQIIAKDNHKTLVTTEGTSAKLSEASVVLVKVAASDVLVVNREGQCSHTSEKWRDHCY